METGTDLVDFEKAANYVKQFASNLDSPQLLYLYARFKQVNEGLCNTSKPGLFDFQGKQKWQAWKDLGTKSKEDCMVEYVSKVSSIDPEWELKVSKVKPLGGLGMAVSSLRVGELDQAVPDADKSLADWVKEGEVERVTQILQGHEGGLITQTDEEGMSVLHWACDRGYPLMVQTLLRHGADINARDADGQTPLHYATSCEHVEVVRTLLQNNADCTLCDNNGDLPETESEEIKDLLKQHR